MNSDAQPTDSEPSSDPYGPPLGAGIDWADPNSPLAPFYMTTGGVVAVVVLGLAFILFSFAPLWHTDFWAHLKYGERIAADRAIPEHEPLCAFTDKQQRFFDSLWLSQVGYHALFRLGSAAAGGDARQQFEGGVEAIRLVHLFAAIAALALFGHAYRRVADSVPWGVVGMLLVLVLMLSLLTVQRPQTLALACYAAVLCGVSRPVVGRVAVVVVPLVLVLWANLHGSFVVGLGLVGIVLLGRVIEVLRTEGWSVRAVWGDSATRRLGLMLALGIVGAGFLTPHGPALFLDVIRFGGSPNLLTMAEWQPLDFSQSRGGHRAYLAIVVLLMGTQIASPRAFTPTQLLLIATLGVWPLFQQRAMAWWVPVVPWIVAPHWVAAAERWGWQLPESIPNFRRTAFSVVLVVVAVIASPASTWLKTGHPRPTPAALHPGTPRDVAAALMGETPADPERVKDLVRAIKEWHGGRYTGRVFTSEIQGEYLLWALPPDMPVMMFNHVQLFPASYWNECMTVKAGGPGWWEFLDRYRVGVVVVELDLNSELCAELRGRSGWAVVIDEANAPARDPYSRLFVAVRKPASRGAQ